ncbi:uncharacterized protein LOC134266110 [Saccostrea cucullata]|uniref:uncharacterized protein LOC134266110 n=1 Tax=Saccostrea cuccullata TaxID=36930 RepID=UPI002ECFF0F0
MDPRTSAQDVMRCDLCETALVQVHCDKCIVNLCKACVGKHISRRENNGHKVVKFQDRKSHLYPTNDLSKLLSGTSNINIYRNLPQEQEMALSLPKFIPREIIGKEFNKLFGALSCNSVSSDEHSYNKKKIQKSSETVINFVDTGYNKLYNVACLSDEEIWTSGNDSTMKLYSINQGSLLKSISTKSGNNTSVIGVTKAGDLVYSDFDDRTVNIVKNKETEEVIRLQNWRPFGVCSSSSGDLLVTMLSDDDYQSKVVPGAVVVVNLAGKLRFSYTGLTPAPKYKPFSPRGITTNIHNHILISDVNNDCVHIIDQDGEFISYIPCGLTKPWGLCTDSNDNLFGAQMEKRQVKKIRYLNAIEYATTA